MDMLAPQDPLDVRAWNGTPISRRTTDGYVNATAMCKANGKKWNDYYRQEQTAYSIYSHLKPSTGFPVSDPITTI
jgi:hypothetical protein